MKEHTPGPWKIDPEPPLAVIEDTEMGYGICEVQDLGADHKTPKANAKLIAAAPDLLEACEEMAESICSLCKRLNSQHERENCTSCEEMDGYKRAIAKATQ